MFIFLVDINLQFLLLHKYTFIQINELVISSSPAHLELFSDIEQVTGSHQLNSKSRHLNSTKKTIFEQI
jgi:hypothetical protein